MRRYVTEVSTPRRTVCPSCEAGELVPDGARAARCAECGFLAEPGVLAALKEITLLPDVRGKHACECGHPEMRLLPDGVYRCPACGAEVLPNRSPGGRRGEDARDRRTGASSERTGGDGRVRSDEDGRGALRASCTP